MFFLFHFGNYENLQIKKLLGTDRFPEKIFNFLLEKYIRNFDLIKFLNELTTLHLTPDTEICGRPIQFMLKFMTGKKK